MIILVGESASGKSSVERMLAEKYGYEPIVSYTTRPPREGEVGGVDYHFISDEEFNERKENGFFAETATYNNWQYGTAKEDYAPNKIAVLTPSGMRKITKNKSIFATSFYIYVQRRDRLIKILQRGDNIDESYRRNLSDVGQFDGIKDEVDFVIENPGYQKSVEEITEEIVNCLTKTNRR